jgi:hypothetical protein
MKNILVLLWLVPESNEKEMEPIRLTLTAKGEFKQFEPSLSETDEHQTLIFHTFVLTK